MRIKKERKKERKRKEEQEQEDDDEARIKQNLPGTVCATLRTKSPNSRTSSGSFLRSFVALSRSGTPPEPRATTCSVDGQDRNGVLETDSSSLFLFFLSSFSLLSLSFFSHFNKN